MKKKIALLLMAAMTISTLAACGNSAAEQAPASTTEEAPAEEAAPAPGVEMNVQGAVTTVKSGKVVISIKEGKDIYLELPI